MNKPDTYSPNKFMGYPDHVAALRRGDPTPPIHVQLILSDLCNEACGFCAYRMDGYTSNELFGVEEEDGSHNNNPNRMIPVDRVMRLIDEMAEVGVEAVQLTGGGEPTVHPQFDQILEALLVKGFNVGLVTNGVKLSARAIELLACFPAAWVRVSFDAASVGLYQAIRRAPAWHMTSALKNLSALASKAREALPGKPRHGGKPRLTVGAGFVVTKENWHEVWECAHMVKQAGADNLRISAVFSTEGADYFKEFHSSAVLKCRGAERLSDDRFTVINMFGDRTEDLILGNPDYDHCWYQYFTTYIGADQNVYRCCVYSYNKRGLIGSIKDQSFAEMWFASGRAKEMEEFNARGCKQCQFNEKNRLMGQAMNNNPSPHQSFV